METKYDRSRWKKIGKIFLRKFPFYEVTYLRIVNVQEMLNTVVCSAEFQGSEITLHLNNFIIALFVDIAVRLPLYVTNTKHKNDFEVYKNIVKSDNSWNFSMMQMWRIFKKKCVFN